MGYRSDVVITIGFKTQEELDTFLAPRLLGYPLREWREYFSRVVDAPNCVMFQLEGVKWFDDCYHNQAIVDLYNESVKCGGAYSFIRLGEDYDDVKQKQGYADIEVLEIVGQHTWVERSIRTPNTHELTFGE